MVLKTGGGTEVQKLALGSSCLPCLDTVTQRLYLNSVGGISPVFPTGHLRSLLPTHPFHITKQLAWLRCGYFHPASLQLRLFVALGLNLTNISGLGNHIVTGSVTLQEGKSIEQNQQSAL